MADRDVRAVCLDIGERAGWTAGQQFVAVLVAGTTAETLFDMPWLLALGTSLGAALISVATTLLQVFVPILRGRGFWGDLIARMVKTFVAAFFGAFAVDKAFNLFDQNIDYMAAANLAAVTTVLALGKGLLARGPNARSPEATASTLDYATYQKATAPVPAGT